MQNAVAQIEFPEIFIGFVAPVGTDIAVSIASFRKFFLKEDYHVVDIKVTDAFSGIRETLGSEVLLDSSHVDNRIKS